MQVEFLDELFESVSESFAKPFILNREKTVSYRLKLYASEEVSSQDRIAAEQRFRRALDDALGDANLVAPIYRAYRQIVATYGEAPGPDLLTEAQQQVFDHWQAAELAAVTAAFGPHRYLEEAYFEIQD